MTEDHLSALLAACEAGKKDKEGWFHLPEGHHLTLYAAFNGAALNVARVAQLKRDGDLVHARTVKGETYVLSLSDLFAGAIEAAAGQARKAGFV
ncbi:MAG: hypothetical protein IPI67_19350 [Myxococcales bacterium]|nr:hypothetical protein [Myxococcales bacterium]